MKIETQTFGCDAKSVHRISLTQITIDKDIHHEQRAHETSSHNNRKIVPYVNKMDIYLYNCTIKNRKKFIILIFANKSWLLKLICILKHLLSSSKASVIIWFSHKFRFFFVVKCCFSRYFPSENQKKNGEKQKTQRSENNYLVAITYFAKAVTMIRLPLIINCATINLVVSILFW